MRITLDLTGRKFGRLTVSHRSTPDPRDGRTRWECRCDCGNTATCPAKTLIGGAKTSCGCLRRESAINVLRTHVNSTDHGMTHTPEHRAWCAIRTRCYNQNLDSFHNYGGRGITVCDRWLNSFEAFYADMGPRPSDKHSIERRDVNGHYEPSNCYWATSDVQANNKRNNVRFDFHGEELTAPQIARRIGMSTAGVQYRLRFNRDLDAPLNPDSILPDSEMLSSSLSQIHIDDVAAGYGVSRATVYRWGVRLGISSQVNFLQQTLREHHL